MKVTVGVKALNEEKHIGASLESALSAVKPFGGEVILADSGSSDRTIEIAQRFPVRIIQFADVTERCCGAAAQLAFQHVESEYFYILDGDMVLQPGFLEAAIGFLDSHPGYAGVGGGIRECNTEALEFQVRARAVQHGEGWQPGDVDRLDCGGLYRKSAIDDAGFFADRNLHAFEEFDLAARLRCQGWKLARIGHHAVDHYGHQLGGYRLLWRRFASGYAGGPGEVLRGSLGRPYLRFVLRDLSHVRHSIAVAVWWLLMAGCAVALPFVIPALLAAPVAYLIFRRRSVSLGVYSFVAWNVGAVAFVLAFLKRRTSPLKPIDSIEVFRLAHSA